MQLALADPMHNRRLLMAAGHPETAWAAARADRTADPGACVTPRRRATDARPVLAEAFESTRAAVHVFTEDGLICHTNPAFDRMFGIPRGEYLGKHVAVLNVSSVAANFGLLEEMQATAAKGGAWRGRVENRRRDGSRFLVELQVRSLLLGDAHYLVGIQEE
jgi:PAS domain S-box-containing protein